MSSSDGGPSPLPSPIFARCSPARGTVAKKCREFYLRRLERTATMQKRWSICCEPPPEEDSPLEPPPPPPQEDEGFPLRKCRSSFDIAMDSLRKEISSLIAQDNDLFRQLLSLHDSIAELRERQRHSAYLEDDDDDLEDEENDEDEECRRRLLSLDSLETSPESTLSSRSSSLSFHKKSRHRKTNDDRPLVFVDKSEICFRCRKVAPPYRRSSSITSLYYLHEDLESYDSGIHLHGSHSDSDHEIFV